MHPDHINDQVLAQYGLPSVRRVLGLTMALYPPGTIMGWRIARQLAQAGLLQETEARRYVEQNSPSTQAEWAEVAKFEKIPEAGYTPPAVTEEVAALPFKARLSEVTFDQDFFNTLYEVLKLYTINAASTRSAAYPLLEGPPGASKSMVVNVTAALLKRPIYTVTGADGSADEIKIELFGGDNADSSDVAGLARRYIAQGWIHNPVSHKLVAQALAAGPFRAFSTELLVQIATLENLKDNITAYQPGKYQLANLNGGILFLDETNGFRGVTTLLTEILENYSRILHPNFFVMGAINPSSARHDREPLAPEIRSRFVTIPVNAPSAKSYEQMLTFLTSGKQPEIVLPNSKRQAVSTAKMLGVTIPPRGQSLLRKVLAENSFSQLLKQLSECHKHIESKLEDGTLDPKRSSVDQISETRAFDRRVLVRTINAINIYLSQILEHKHSAADPFGGGEEGWLDYQTRVSGTSAELKPDEVAQAITSALTTLYLRACDFAIDAEVTLEANKKLSFTNASKIVEKIFELHGLTQEKLAATLKTNRDLQRLQEAWRTRFQASPLFDATQVENITRQAMAKDYEPDNESIIFLHNRESNRVHLCNMGYLRLKPDRKRFMESYYPGLNITDQTQASSLTSILDAALNQLKAENSRFVSPEEAKEIGAFMQETRKRLRDALICMPMYNPASDELSVVVMPPSAAFAETHRKSLGSDTHGVLGTTLRTKSRVLVADNLFNFTSRLYGGQALTFAPDIETVVLQYTVDRT